MKLHHGSGFTRIELLVLLAVIATLGALAYPDIQKAKRNADKAKAICCSRNIGMALGEFDNDYGRYPDASTQIKLTKSGFRCPTGDTANDYLAQLIAAKYLDAEEVFFAKGVRGTRVGDNDVSTPDRILAQGENSFGYVMLSDGSSLSSSIAKSTTPVLVAPLVRGGFNPTFDPLPYNGRMIYFKADGSVAEALIKGKAGLLKKGRTLFETGPETQWGTFQPDVKEPNRLSE